MQSCSRRAGRNGSSGDSEKNIVLALVQDVQQTAEQRRAEGLAAAMEAAQAQHAQHQQQQPAADTEQVQVLSRQQWEEEVEEVAEAGEEGEDEVTDEDLGRGDYEGLQEDGDGIGAWDDWAEDEEEPAEFEPAAATSTGSAGGLQDVSLDVQIDGESPGGWVARWVGKRRPVVTGFLVSIWRRKHCCRPRSRARIPLQRRRCGLWRASQT